MRGKKGGNGKIAQNSRLLIEKKELFRRNSLPKNFPGLIFFDVNK